MFLVHFDDDLGLRPWHERPAVRLQREPAEVPVAEHVSERLALPAALDELACGCALRVGKRAVVLGVELDAREPERACQQQLGVDARRLDPATREILGRALQYFSERHPSSARRCCSLVRASVYSSRSPWRT